MVSQRKQVSRVLDPLLNPLEFWQNYLINWIQAYRGFYEKAIMAKRFKAFWEPWLRAAGTEQKEW